MNRFGGTMALGKRTEEQKNLREGMIPEWVSWEKLGRGRGHV